MHDSDTPTDTHTAPDSPSEASPITITWQVFDKQGEYTKTRTAEDADAMILLLSKENVWGSHTPQVTCNRYYYQATGEHPKDGENITAVKALEVMAAAGFLTIS